MGTRGRKSAAELSVAPFTSPRVSLGPPVELTDAQAAVWRDAVASMRNGQLTRGAFPILIAYCRHVCRARTLENLIDGFSIDRLKGDSDYLPIFDKLLAIAERETRAATACARA